MTVMVFWLQTLLWVILSPEQAFLRIAHAPSMAVAAFLLVVLCMLVPAALCVSSLMPYQHSSSAQQSKINDIYMVVGCGLVLPLLWFWMALLTQSLLHLLRVASTFDRVFCLLAFASLPQSIIWLTFPLRNFHWCAFQMWRLILVGSLLWTTALVIFSLRTGCGVNGWELLLVSAPISCLLWAVGVPLALQLPRSLQAKRIWQRATGERIIIFAPLTAKTTELAEIARNADWALEQATKLLEVEPLAFKVGVFLFSDREEHRRALQVKKNMAGGYAYADGLTSVYASWEKLKHIVPHELGHVLREQRITSKPIAFLDEGLAEYVNGKLFDQAAHNPVICLPHTLRVLAQDVIFYNWRCIEQGDFPAANYYSHAHGFVRFLIQNLGIDAFKQLMREAAEDKSEDAGERLENAVQKVYKMSLAQLEAKWRQKETASMQSQPQSKHFLTYMPSDVRETRQQADNP